MKVFVAGASGAIGHVLIPQLIKAGYAVTALSRTPAKLETLNKMGATPVLGDVFDRPQLSQLMEAASPDVVIHQLTSFGAGAQNPFTETNRLRTEGTANLIHAAQHAQAKRFIAQSVAFLCQSTDGDLTHADTPLYLDASPPLQSVVAALADLERQVLSLKGMTGIVLRYGHFYGPRTFYAGDGMVAAAVRQRQYPIVNQAQGTYSFIHIEDAAVATVQAMTHGTSGIYTVVDDSPVLLREWLPDYAQLLQAHSPEIISQETARTMLDPFSLYFATLQQGATNHKTRQELGWQPRYPNWYDGFQVMLAA